MRRNSAFAMIRRDIVRGRKSRRCTTTDATGGNAFVLISIYLSFAAEIARKIRQQEKWYGR